MPAASPVGTPPLWAVRAGSTAVLVGDRAAIVDDRHLDRQQWPIGGGVPVRKLQETVGLVERVVPGQDGAVDSVFADGQRLAGAAVELVPGDLFDGRGQAAPARGLVARRKTIVRLDPFRLVIIRRRGQ